MRKFLVMLTFASAIVSSNALAQDAGSVIPPTVPPAPVGHAQPTARSFTPNSTADEIEQHRLFGVRRATAPARRVARQEAEHLPLLRNQSRTVGVGETHLPFGFAPMA
jgi:hypothetical protein